MLRRLAAFAVLNAVVVNGLMLACGTPARDTDLDPLAWFLEGRQGGDSWRPMLRAYDHLRTREGRSRGVYERLFFNPEAQRNPFQYPPTSLLAVWLAERLGGERRLGVLEATTWACVPLLAALCLALFVEARRHDPGVAPPGRLWWLAAAALALFLAATFYPAIRAYRNGQIQTWINTGFGLLLLLWLRGARAGAGAVVGAICLVKPHYAAIVLWGALRRQWRFAAAATGVGALGLSLSLLLFGAPAHQEYLPVVSFAARHGESFYANQSFNGLLQRALHNGENLEWRMQFPPFHPLVYAGTLASSALLLALALWPPRQASARGNACDLALVSLAATLASPIAWEHHYGMLLPLFALLLPRLVRAPELGRATLPLLALAYVLSGHTLRVTDALAGSAWNVLQSYTLAGGLIVFALLLRSRSSPA